MATEQSKSHTVYEVYCRECEWRAENPIDLKGTANLIAGRHISRTDHVVALKTIEQPADEDEDFYRGGDRSVSFELLRSAPDDKLPAELRQCGPVACLVEPT